MTQMEIYVSDPTILESKFKLNKFFQIRLEKEGKVIEHTFTANYIEQLLLNQLGDNQKFSE